MIYYKFDRLFYGILFMNLGQIAYTAALCTGHLYWPVVVFFTIKYTFFHIVMKVNAFRHTPTRYEPDFSKEPIEIKN